MRVTVRRVVEALAVYPSRDDVRREYPELEPDDIRQALDFAAQNLDDSIQPFEAARTGSCLIRGCRIAVWPD